MSSALYDIPLQRIDGTPASLGEYQGSVLLIVNVASKCGLTPQYEGLEKIYENYRDKGFAVLGFPSNDFAGQEPGSEAEIQSFCRGTLGVQFPLFSKISLKGDVHPLYSSMIREQPQALPSQDPKLRGILSSKGLLPENPSDVTWNFEKFLINRKGEVVGRFAPDITPEDPVLVQAIEGALAN
ncbi:MAG: glutathione peroxidase [Janthinobacterium lividum]